MKQILYYGNRQVSKLSYRLVLISLIITAGLFIMMPLLEVLVKSSKKMSLRRVETMEIMKKQPPLQPKRKQKVKPPQPRLNRHTERLSIMPIDLALAISPGAGDFALDFGFGQLADSGSMVFEISDVDKKPEIVHQVKPLYPLSARHQKIEGKVVVEFVVLSTGRVDRIKIKHASPPGIFDHAAVQAVKKWRFKPGTKSNKAVAIRVAVPLVFGLEDK